MPKPAKRTNTLDDATRAYPPSIVRLIEAFARMPGIGKRSAERLALHVLRQPLDQAMDLAQAIGDVRTKVRSCPISYNFTDADTCTVSDDPRRDHATVLVVEQPKDVIVFEQTGMYRGTYHVLLGRISPLDGVGPEHLTLDRLLQRIDDPAINFRGVRIEEVILGLNPTLEGDGTALYLAEQLADRPVRITRLARGLPTGRELEFANAAVLADALEGRRSV